MRMQEVSEEELQTMNVQMFPEKGRRNSRTMFRP
jgi:hypothetical protein